MAWTQEVVAKNEITLQKVRETLLGEEEKDTELN